MNPEKITTHVHRFRDWVAVSIHNGPTVYLSPEQAHRFATAMDCVVLDVRTVPFTASTVKSHEMTMEGRV